MGVWGVKPFENDDAADWSSETFEGFIESQLDSPEIEDDEQKFYITRAVVELVVLAINGAFVSDELVKKCLVRLKENIPDWWLEEWDDQEEIKQAIADQRVALEQYLDKFIAT
jgi:hypothetical protein